MTVPLITAARAYLGTPWRHRGRTATGLDCGGLVWRAYADLGLVMPDMRAYGREPHRDGLMATLREALGEPVAGPAQEGDVVVFRFVRDPHHVGLIATAPYGALTLLHAYGEAGKVVEHRYSDDWAQRLVAIFRRPV